MLLNKNLTFELIRLPETEQEETTAIALGDFNGDGLVDIVFGNVDKSDSILLNKGDKTFKKTELPGGALRTQGIALGDLDGDGFVEIVSVYRSDTPQITFSSSCPNGGARPFTSSWCFRCPAYTGRPASILDYEQSSCVECLPDILQQSDDGERCSVDPCFLRQRKLGSKTCDRCEGGSFFDSRFVRSEKDRSSWERDRCVKCPQGPFTENGPQGTISTSNRVKQKVHKEHWNMLLEVCKFYGILPPILETKSSHKVSKKVKTKGAKVVKEKGNNRKCG